MNMEAEKMQIIPLPKEQWEGTIIPMRYETTEYYDVQIVSSADGYQVNMEKRKFPSPVRHYPEEYDYPDKLYQKHWEKAFAWGIVEEHDGKSELIACIETCPEEWSNRLMVTELWVHEKMRRKGIAHRLMAIAKEQAVLEHRRAIILETQSCNVGAIRFYQKEGFELIGFDSCCYSNHDIKRKEVRFNLGYFLRKKKVKREDIVIRQETKDEYHQTEEMTLKAFWNKHHLGCNEHLLVHKLRNSEYYLPELSRIAVVDGEIVGAIYYVKSLLKHAGKEKEIITFGPLCVASEWQGCGVGSVLLGETLKLAKNAGYEGVVIFGEPDYYPLHGFKTCDHFGVTTIDGKNFDAFLGIELVEGGLSEFGGRFMEPDVFEDLPEEENEAFTKTFHAPAKQKFPCQWD
ncbi:MAG: GNAT family N-acetyltransferase [Lachnospiraceae bacterium]